MVGVPSAPVNFARRALSLPSTLSLFCAWSACAPSVDTAPCEADSACGDEELCIENECRLVLPPLPPDDEAPPPLAARGAVVTASEDVVRDVPLEFTGGDGTAISWRTSTETPDIGVCRILEDDATLRFTPAPERSGLASCGVTPIQSGRFGQPAQVFIDVGAVDDSPVLSVNGPFNTSVDTSLAIGVRATDREAEDVTFTAIFDVAGEAPAVGFDDNVAQIVYTPEPGFVGVDEGEVTATDESGAVTTVKVIITVE